MKKLKKILQSRYLFKILTIIFIIYSILILNLKTNNNYYKEDNISISGIITSYEIKGASCIINLRTKENLIIYYYFKDKLEKEYYQKNLRLGITLNIKGKIYLPNSNTIPNGFNYKKYLQIKEIYYLISANKITIEKNNISILYAIKNKLINRIDKIDETGYFRTFILGDKTLLNTNTLKEYQTNGISHLFSISGMHISLIVSIIYLLLDKISYNRIYKYSIIIPILLLYLFLTNFSSSITRTVIMFILFALNECFHLKIKKLDIMLITLIVAIIIKPLIIFDIGFQFSYIISFTLIIFNKKIRTSKNKIHQNLIVSLICFLVSFPICIYHFNQVNIISILFNLIMIPFISIIIFPLTLITFILPILYPIYYYLINVLEQINHLINQISIFTFIFIKPSIFIILLYYIIIILSLFKKQVYILFCLMVLIHLIYPCLSSNPFITVLDVEQGDSIFIKLPNNKGNLLIDTGGKIETKKEKWQQEKNKTSIVDNKIIPYLKSLGIYKLNYLILTHGDYDHMGEAINLVNNFKVEKVIFNCGEFNELEQELTKVLDKKKIPYYSCIKELNIDKNKLYFLNNKIYDNENDNSLVIYTELNNHKFLFMGDAGVEVENDLINKYNLQDIDVLKVGHHGSRTSSGKEFVDKINSKYSIISVGKNNRYGHPNDNVLDNLSDSKIYRTDLDGSIMFEIKNNKLRVDTCAP